MNSSPVLLLIFITLVFITLVSIPYWWFSLSRHLKNGKTEKWKNGNLAFNTASLESGKWKKINIQKALPRIRSEQYFICEIFKKRFYQIYRGLYGDTMFVSLSGSQIWPPETNRNICFWVFLLMPEFFPLGTHKDLSNIYSETRNVHIAKSPNFFNPQMSFPGCQLGRVTQKPVEIQSPGIAKRRTLLNRKFVCMKVLRCCNTV